MRISKRGFTIVELLIVIVIIGILAAIIVVAYNGITTRARNTQTINAANIYHKAILQYAAVKGSYPTASGCLGAAYQNNQCWEGGSGNTFINTALDSQLSEFVSTKPTTPQDRVSIGVGDNKRIGIYYRDTDKRIYYYLQGLGQPCLGGFTALNEGGVISRCDYAYPAL